MQNQYRHHGVNISVDNGECRAVLTAQELDANNHDACMPCTVGLTYVELILYSSHVEVGDEQEGNRGVQGNAKNTVKVHMKGASTATLS